MTSVGATETFARFHRIAHQSSHAYPHTRTLSDMIKLCPRSLCGYFRGKDDSLHLSGAMGAGSPGGGAGAPGSKACYPALLHQEKSLGVGDVREYTHVWEMHPLDLTSHDPLGDPTYVCRRHLCEYHQQSLQKELLEQGGVMGGVMGGEYGVVGGGVEVGYDGGTGTGPPAVVGDSTPTTGATTRPTSRGPTPPPVAPKPLPPSALPAPGPAAPTRPGAGSQAPRSHRNSGRNQLVLFDSNTSADPAQYRAAEL